jgi:hypothetical protein
MGLGQQAHVGQAHVHRHGGQAGTTGTACATDRATGTEYIQRPTPPKHTPRAQPEPEPPGHVWYRMSTTKKGTERQSAYPLSFRHLACRGRPGRQHRYLKKFFKVGQPENLLYFLVYQGHPSQETTDVPVSRLVGETTGGSCRASPKSP